MKFLAFLHMGENLEKVNKQTYLFFFFTYFEVMFIKKNAKELLQNSFPMSLSI